MGRSTALPAERTRRAAKRERNSPREVRTLNSAKPKHRWRSCVRVRQACRRQSTPCRRSRRRVCSSSPRRSARARARAISPISAPRLRWCSSTRLGGASAISVRTERRRLGGSLADLDAVRARVDVPILRKDFMADPYQLWEPRAHGADLALLMVVSLGGSQPADMIGLCEQLGMTPLVESHTADELEQVVSNGARLLGINVRNLTTLELDRSVFRELAPLVAPGRVRMAESGEQQPEDIAEYRRWGADVVLVGEALVRAGNPHTSIQDFITTANNKAQGPDSQATGPRLMPHVPPGHAAATRVNGQGRTPT
ncbi:indole-3-glycerol phosphate synthase TrpC [Streptomyces mirabilis]|uniref:indole-3-glycerol phosphate synthase TrpC n=1 Tax=Streptomyces mirabilis TaxID=68239 RepID=UPI0036F36458